METKKQRPKVDITALFRGGGQGSDGDTGGDDEETAEEEDTRDGPELVKSFFQKGKAGDFAGAYDDLEAAVMLCTQEKE